MNARRHAPRRGELPPGRTLATPGSFVSIDTGPGGAARLQHFFVVAKGLASLAASVGCDTLTSACARICPGRRRPARPWSRIENGTFLIARPDGARRACARSRQREGQQDAGDRSCGCRRCRHRRRGRRCDAGRGAAGGRAVLQGQVDRHDHRLSARRLERHLCARARAPHRQAHPRPAQCRAEEHARRRQLPRGQQRLRRRAQGRHRARDRRADDCARRAARHRQCALQDRRAWLGRPRRFADQHRVHVAHVEGEDLRRRAEIRIDAVGNRRRLDGVDLSDRHEQRVRRPSSN